MRRNTLKERKPGHQKTKSNKMPSRRTKLQPVKKKFTKTYTRKFKKPLGHKNVPDEKELKYLEKIVLGTGSTVFEGNHPEDDSEEEVSFNKSREAVHEKKPAWIDEDDNHTCGEVSKHQRVKFKAGAKGSKNYQTIARKKFQDVMGVPKWSKISVKDENSSDNFLNTCGKFIKKPQYLAAGKVEYKKLTNLNNKTRSEGPEIRVVKFHPKSTVAMVAGVSGMVSLFQVDGKENTKLQSIQFSRYPIHCGAFLKNGEEFLVGSKYYKFFHCHNLMTGKSYRVDHSKLNNITKTEIFCVSPNDDFIAVCGDTGNIFILAASTKEYVDSLQMNCDVTALCFSQDGSLLYSHGEDGDIYVWDMKSRTCIKKFYDDGCLTGTSIAVSNNEQFLACGSSSGIVNIYDREAVLSGDVRLPVRTLYNLVTPVTSAVFNSTSEILAIASREKEKSVKLIHCPSMTVFSNFPDFLTKIKSPFCVDFSPNSGFFAVGDSGGFAHLFRLKYYGNY